MSLQMYTAGQIVTVAANSLTGPRTGDHFRIVRRYSIPNRAPFYHVHSLVDRSQRMVSERELSSVIPTIADAATASGKVVRLFPQIVRFDLGANRLRNVAGRPGAVFPSFRRPH